MKTKLIYSNFDQETGQSVAIIQNKYGIFSGVSDLHPEEENVSSFVGCRYAEIRAYMEYYRHRRDLIDEQLKGLIDFQNILKGTWNYNDQSTENRRLRKRIHELKEERKSFTRKIELLKQTLKNSMENRDNFVKNFLTK